VTWQGGERGYDRPLDRAFVTVQRKKRGWRTVDSDLGLNVLWTVDDNGVYKAEWEVPLNAPEGKYRFVIHANRYGLTSSAFTIKPSHALTVTQLNSRAGTVAVELHYPQATQHEAVGDPAGDLTADLTARPELAAPGSATFLVNGKATTVKGFVVAAPAGAAVELKPGAVRDKYGNTNGNALAP
jgi:hypothetical protein